MERGARRRFERRAASWRTLALAVASVATTPLGCDVDPLDYTGKTCADGRCPSGYVCDDNRRCRRADAAAGSPGGGARPSFGGEAGEAQGGRSGAAGTPAAAGEAGHERAAAGALSAGGDAGLPRAVAGGEAGRAAGGGGRGGREDPAGGHAGAGEVARPTLGTGGEAGIPSGGGEAGGPSAGGEAGTPSAGGEAGVPSAGGAGGEAPAVPPSCDGLPASCGSNDDDDCCRTLSVEGGSFVLGAFTTPTPVRPATVSGFHLDRYEVTVGRFRKFVDDYDAFRASGSFHEGSGEHPLIPGSGWQARFDARLPANSEELLSALRCGWSMIDAPNEQLPINCVSWYEAFAFCVWDGGRLPSEAEWEYAAVGGNEGRVFPWGSTPSSEMMMVGDCLGDYNAGCTFSDIRPVGSRPDGVGRWGQLDLLGSMYEWVLDSPDDYPEVCDDCANLWMAKPESDYRRTFRGGGWTSWLTFPLYRREYECCLENPRFSVLGIRCAR